MTRALYELRLWRLTLRFWFAPVGFRWCPTLTKRYEYVDGQRRLVFVILSWWRVQALWDR